MQPTQGDYWVRKWKNSDPISRTAWQATRTNSLPWRVGKRRGLRGHIRWNLKSLLRLDQGQGVVRDIDGEGGPANLQFFQNSPAKCWVELSNVDGDHKKSIIRVSTASTCKNLCIPFKLTIYSTPPKALIAILNASCSLKKEIRRGATERPYLYGRPTRPTIVLGPWNVLQANVLKAKLSEVSAHMGYLGALCPVGEKNLYTNGFP